MGRPPAGSPPSRRERHQGPSLVTGRAGSGVAGFERRSTATAPGGMRPGEHTGIARAAAINCAVAGMFRRAPLRLAVARCGVGVLSRGRAILPCRLAVAVAGVLAGGSFVRADLALLLVVVEHVPLRPVPHS